MQSSKMSVVLRQSVEAVHLRAFSWAVGMAITRLLVPYCISFTALAVFSSTRMCAFRGSGTPKPARESRQLKPVNLGTDTGQLLQSSLATGMECQILNAGAHLGNRAHPAGRQSSATERLPLQDSCRSEGANQSVRVAAEGGPRLAEDLEHDRAAGRFLHLEVSATTMTAAAAEAATRRRSAGTRGEPDRKTKTLPNLRSSGMMRRKVFSISTLDRLLSTTTVLPPSLL